MNIVLASNDGFVQHLSVTLISLLENNRWCPRVDVYILSLGISPANQALLEKMVAPYACRLHFIPLSDIHTYYDFNIDTGRFNPIILGRLFIARLLPPEVERLIYFDCDIVIAKSVQKLWETDLDDCIGAMAMEPTANPEIKRQIGFGDHDPYYNSGVLLIDMNKWREKGIEDQLISYFAAKGGKLMFADQDLLNVILKGSLKLIRPTFNFYAPYKYHRHGTLVKKVPAYAQISKDEYNAAKRDPSVVHFLGHERPWMRGNLNPYRRLYHHYLAMTPFKDAKPVPGKELYLFCFHVMEWLTVLCPPLRTFISNTWGLKVK